MSLWMVVPLLIVILLVWVVVRFASGPSTQDTPEQILKRRYARGEIEREEYERRLNDLRK
jgi:putative membrane protein